MEKKYPDTRQETDASNIKLNEELDNNISTEEPILKDNPNRFVLFPNTQIFGKCTKSKKQVFGLQKNWIYLLILQIGIPNSMTMKGILSNIYYILCSF